MPIDPLSTVIALALAVPLPTTYARTVRMASTRGRPAGEQIHVEPCSLETDRLVVPVWVETEQLAVPLSDLPTVSRLEKIMTELDGYARFPDGWDGDHSRAPTPASLAAAKAFASAIPAGMPLPVPMLSPTGEAGFYWNEGSGYADVSFDHDGFCSFFSKTIGGHEFFEEKVQVGDMTRQWFLDKVGPITAPMLQAA